MKRGVSIAKFTDNIPNEDSLTVDSKCLVVSDGAGGCGVFSDEWSKYLVEKLDRNKPIVSFEQLDKWVDSIWEPFYQSHEEKAKLSDGIFQSKFYAEGSYATIAAVWKQDKNRYLWMTYGDSVVFHYNKISNNLEHSFTKLCDFSKPPYLISCKDPLQKEGFKSGEFLVDDNSVVFACSDALSHYVLMMYMMSHHDKYHEEIEEILKSKSSDSYMVGLAATIDCFDFYTDVITKLEDVSESEEDFSLLMQELYSRGLVDIDDYTIAFLKYDNEPCNTL